MFLMFDTETEGLVNRKQEYWSPSQPPVVQVGAMLFDKNAIPVATLDAIVYPDGFTIAPPRMPEYPGRTIEEVRADKLPINACDINGVTQERAEAEGVDGSLIMSTFNYMCSQAEFAIAHNADFDQLAMNSMAHRLDMECAIPERVICTMKSTTDLCKLQPYRYGSFKWPTLTELHTLLFGEGFEGAHDALTDVKALARCFFELRSKNLVKKWSLI